MSGHVPIRTCVGCRRAEPATTMVRCVYNPACQCLVVDADRRLPGRGAWIHPDATCVERARRSRAFARALRLDPATSVVPTWEELVSAYHAQTEP